MNHLSATGTQPRCDCGQTHSIPLYGLGCYYARHLALAASEALNDDLHAAVRHHDLADSALQTLSEVTNPEDFRDFIAGTHHWHESQLASIGVTIHT